MENLKKILKKTCKVCEFSHNLSGGEMFILPTKTRGKDNVFICNYCLNNIRDEEEEE